MAARENQPLQIALVLFVMLTVLLSVTTFLFFRKYRDEQMRIAGKNQSIDEAKADLQKENDKSQKLLLLMGGRMPEGVDAVAPTPEAVQELFVELRAHYGIDLGKLSRKGDEKKVAAVRDYSTLVQFLHAQLVDANSLVEVEKKKNENLVDEKADLQSKSQIAITAAEQAKAKAGTDLESERAAFNKTLADKDQTNKNNGGLLVKRIGEIEDLKAKERAILKKSNDDIQKLTDATIKQAEKIKIFLKEEFSVPDGEIRLVNHADNIVYINLGSGHLLRPKTTFSVYGVDENNLTEKTRKGKIEVTRIVDRNQAEARITESTLRDPILRGDRIYSPVWHPGRPTHFAVAGFIDLDGDGQSDRKLVLDLIRLNGGVIDAEVDDEGNSTGRMTVNTQYLVLGERPRENATAELLNKYGQIISEAQHLGVEQINSQDLLDRMGYTSDERTVRLDGTGRPEDFIPKPDPKAPAAAGGGGSVSDTFKKRRPGK